MKRTVWIMIGIMGCLLWFLPQSAGAAETGKELFIKYKCNRCHSVEAENIEATSEKMKAKTPDLSDIGDKVESAQWITQWVLKQIERDGKKHKAPKFKGTEAELTTIAEWLMTLKKKGNP